MSRPLGDLGGGHPGIEPRRHAGAPEIVDPSGQPTRGRISYAPVVPDLAGLSTDGPIARTVADAAALLDVMTHDNPGDLYYAPPPELGSFSAYAGRDPGRLRIARYAEPPVPGAVVEPEVLAAYERASAELAGLGHEVVDIDPPFTADLVPQFVTLWCAFACMHPSQSKS